MAEIEFIENVDKAISDLNKSINELSEIRDILIKAKQTYEHCNEVLNKINN